MKKTLKSSIELMRKIKFINSYSFVFSPRPGTPASNLEGINDNVSKDRLRLFQKFSNEIKFQYRQSLLNKKIKVLFENKTNNINQYFGRDEYNNSVIVNSSENLTGKIYNVYVSSLNQNTLFGKIDFNINNEYFAA